jgi:hypothetical protein
VSWRTTLPDDWDAVPADPPAVDRGLEGAWIGDTVVVRERDGPGFVATEQPVDCVDANPATPRDGPPVEDPSGSGSER